MRYYRPVEFLKMMHQSVIIMYNNYSYETLPFIRDKSSENLTVTRAFLVRNLRICFVSKLCVYARIRVNFFNRIQILFIDNYPY